MILKTLWKEKAQVGAITEYCEYQRTSKLEDSSSCAGTQRGSPCSCRRGSGPSPPPAAASLARVQGVEARVGGAEEDGGHLHHQQGGQEEEASGPCPLHM